MGQRQMKVLLSDQDRQSAERLQREIEAGDSAWQVEIATSTEEFETLAATGEYQVVVWELSSPGAAGLVSLRRIRAAAPGAVLLVSAFPGGEALAAQTLSEGADAYLMQRPGWSDDLLAMLAQVEKTGQAPAPDPTPLPCAPECAASLEGGGEWGAQPEWQGEPAQQKAFLDRAPRPLLVLTPTGRIEACNQAAADLTGYSRPSLRGQAWSEFLLTPASGASLLAALGDPTQELPAPGPGLLEARREGEGLAAELLVAGSEGQYRLYTAHLRPLPAALPAALLVSLDREEPAPAAARAEQNGARGKGQGETKTRGASDAARVAQLEDALRNLTEAVRCLESVRAPHDLPAQVLEAVAHLVDCDTAVCRMDLACNGEGRQQGQASVGLAEADAASVAERLETLLHGGNLPRQPLIVADLEELRRRGSEVALQLTLGGAGVASAVWIPVILAGEPVGFVFLGSRSKEAFPTWLQPVLDLFGAEVGRAAAAATVFYQMQLSASLAQQLLRISVALNAHDDLEDVLRRVSEAAVSISGGACCWVEILDEQAQQFVSTHRHCPDPHLARDLYVEVHRVAWQAVEMQAPAQTETQVPAGTQYQIIAVPLRAEGRVVGVMTLAHLAGRRVGSLALNALQVLATQAATAVRNMQLLALAAERTRRMEAAAIQAREEETRARTVLQAAASVTESRDLKETITQIARSAAQEIGFERVRVFLADHQAGVLEGRAEAYSDGSVLDIDAQTIPLRAGADLLADVALSSAPYLMYSVTGDEQDEGAGYEQLLMPLRWQGDLVGIIAADNRSSRRSISSQQTRLLRALATLAEVAIERARMDEARHQLVSAMSHELRRPLASIQAYNELVLGGDAGPVNEEQRMYLRRVEEGCGRLARMIEDLLNWSKLRSGRVTVDRKLWDLRDAVQEVARELEPKAGAASVELVVDVTERLPRVETDPNLLIQVLSNLVENAIKYNHPGGRVQVRLRAEDHAAVIEVTDTGPGIPPEFRGKIFEEFERGPRELHGKTEGTGLGLPIAARLTEYLGGSLELESKVGEGSTFKVKLPYAR